MGLLPYFTARISSTKIMFTVMHLLWMSVNQAMDWT